MVNVNIRIFWKGTAAHKLVWVISKYRDIIGNIDEFIGTKRKFALVIKKVELSLLLG
jgi:hypothetical protein